MRFDYWTIITFFMPLARVLVKDPFVITLVFSIDLVFDEALDFFFLLFFFLKLLDLLFED